MYRIVKEYYAGTDSGNTLVEVEIVCDTVANLPAYNSIANKIIVPGSIAIIPDDSDYYMLNFSNTWVKWER